MAGWMMWASGGEIPLRGSGPWPAGSLPSSRQSPHTTHPPIMSITVASWARAEARRYSQWKAKQANDIRRQLLDRDTTYFGRKRRARRARGRQIDGRWNPPYVGGRIWFTCRQPGLRTLRSNLVTLLWDEVDSFNCGLTEEQARAEIAAETERWRKLIDPSVGEPWEAKADV